MSTNISQRHNTPTNKVSCRGQTPARRLRLPVLTWALSLPALTWPSRRAAAWMSRANAGQRQCRLRRHVASSRPPTPAARVPGVRSRHARSRRRSRPSHSRTAWLLAARPRPRRWRACAGPPSDSDSTRSGGLGGARWRCSSLPGVGAVGLSGQIRHRLGPTGPQPGLGLSGDSDPAPLRGSGPVKRSESDSELRRGGPRLDAGAGG